MPQVTHIGRVMVPSNDFDAAIAWYRDRLGFSLAADVPFGDGDRWVEMSTPNGGASIAFVPPHGMDIPHNTGIILASDDPAADHAELEAGGVDVDDLLQGDGTVPTLFFFRDGEGNQLMIVEQRG